MTINEAIKILDKYLHGPDDPDTYDFDEALKFGLEALKLIKDMRRSAYLGYFTRLPGETEK